MAKRSAVLDQSEAKRTKKETATCLSDIISTIESFDAKSISSQTESSKELGERLLRLLQLTKDISVCLREPSRRPRSTLTIKDVKLADSQEDLSSLPLWRTGLAETNRLMLNALTELLDDREAQQQDHLNMMVDTFAEELDQIRQSEDLGPSKLELLIDSLKTGALLHQ